MEEVRVIMRESQGGSPLLAGGAQCHFFNCQQTCQHIATTPMPDKRTQGENTAQTNLETFAESSRFPRCKTMQDPTYPPLSTTDKLYDSVPDKGERTRKHCRAGLIAKTSCVHSILNTHNTCGRNPPAP